MARLFDNTCKTYWFSSGTTCKNITTCSNILGMFPNKCFSCKSSCFDRRPCWSPAHVGQQTFNRLQFSHKTRLPTLNWRFPWVQENAGNYTDELFKLHWGTITKAKPTKSNSVRPRPASKQLWKRLGVELIKFWMVFLSKFSQDDNLIRANSRRVFGIISDTSSFINAHMFSMVFKSGGKGGPLK